MMMILFLLLRYDVHERISWPFLSFTLSSFSYSFSLPILLFSYILTQNSFYRLVAKEEKKGWGEEEGRHLLSLSLMAFSDSFSLSLSYVSLFPSHFSLSPFRCILICAFLLISIPPPHFLSSSLILYFHSFFLLISLPLSLTHLHRSSFCLSNYRIDYLFSLSYSLLQWMQWRRCKETNREKN